ncbi:MAG: tRNA uridine-5-carboxymethylaminomethyl(34) synthesis enzyme MnmG [Candidatus Glassbacteria bacterium]|nr:tRNA uridine-5-carboxymethylaminomethyl(34) synthesis enzyme MnmG [Candidatus Glassbacteria bacterium]
MSENSFDIVVIGAGHAGVEAARAASAAGARVLLITSRPDAMGQMSCNPAIGGVAKGQLVREIDALGGLMARATDRASIQFRMLNTSKGPAVRSPRSQSDRRLYLEAVSGLVSQLPGVTVAGATATSIATSGNRVAGVLTDRAGSFDSKAVVLAAGTFLNGTIRVGDRELPAGRAGDASSIDLAQNLKELGLSPLRFKTGTPPRIDRKRVNLEVLAEQPGDDPSYRFSFFHDCDTLPQVSCWHARTSPRTRSLVMDNLKRSSMYGGWMEGTGPRYCPSIEDKFVKFPDRDAHHLFLEPEGLDTDEMYLNGLSNSLPLEIQQQLVNSIEGLELAGIIRPGYAIEYDCYDPTELDLSLQSRKVAGLFLAGQVNGTSGYEEAAGQGLAAGLNAALFIRGEQPVIFDRAQSYLGVLIDDIVTCGVDEPYRLFSSRAEFRLSLRQDNADLRLSPLAYRLGLITGEQYESVLGKQRRAEELIELCRATRVGPEKINPLLREAGSAETGEALSVEKILRRPEIEIGGLFAHLDGEFGGHPAEVLAQVEMEIKYAGYMARERTRHEQAARLDRVKIPASLDYSSIQSLSTESRQRIAARRPATLGQASRIPGIRPGDITSLMVALSRKKSK